MALKAMLVFASFLALAVALPAPEDQLEISEVKAVPVSLPLEQVVYAQERGDHVESAGGWGEEPQGWGWQPPKASGWGWPKFKYLKFTIPIPILPRIKFGIKGGLKLNAAIQHPKGWGWSK